MGAGQVAEWSPDGNRLAIRACAALVADRGALWEPADRESFCAIPENQTGEVAWSPDGAAVACSECSPCRMFVAPAPQSAPKPQRLVGDVIAGGREPAWSPNNDFIAFGGFLDNRSRIFLIRPDGSGLHPLLGRRR
jgi:Tol biopolymer transport system component